MVTAWKAGGTATCVVTVPRPTGGDPGERTRLDILVDDLRVYARKWGSEAMTRATKNKRVLSIVLVTLTALGVVGAVDVLAGVPQVPSVSDLAEISGIDNDGTNWWVSAHLGDDYTWKVHRVASDRSTILASYDLPYDPPPGYIEHIDGVACRDGYAYVRIHPSGPIYKLDPSDGSYTTSSYSTRIWVCDMAFFGSTLWQTRDESGGNYEVFLSLGDEFTLTEIPGRKVITSDGSHLYIGDV
ncbi:MAG: hypothetical protein AMJ46_14240 [Latescibacteria bacterium DG_63]|nr:MAG: hypothetical protein AMJ46_14240 [Latescibacteria bacterium DG_63]